jgi:glucose-1-phosphate adenylyltransferase
MRSLAMILAGGAGSRLSVLTQKRAKPAVPFAGKYRIIDFTLSNCVNSGVYTVGVCTQYRPRSLHDHIRTGQPWDLDRNAGGVTLLQPYIGRTHSDWYQGTADAIYQNLDFVLHYHPDVVLVLSGDHIYKLDYDVMTTFHLEHEADLTIAALRVPVYEARRFGMLRTAGDYQVVGFEEKPVQPSGTLASMGVYAFTTNALRHALEADRADPRSSRDFGRDIIPRLVDTHRVFAFPFGGYWVDVGTIGAYWQAHRDLLLDSPPLDLFERGWVIHTRSEERQPAGIRGTADVRQSLISDGCLIEGLVERSVLSPGVVVRPGAQVRDSIVMTDTLIERDAAVDHAILDKRIHIGREALVGWDEDRATVEYPKPEDRLTVIGKNSTIPAGVRLGRSVVVAADFDLDASESRQIPDGAHVGGMGE